MVSELNTIYAQLQHIIEKYLRKRGRLRREQEHQVHIDYRNRTPFDKLDNIAGDIVSNAAKRRSKIRIFFNWIISKLFYGVSSSTKSGDIAHDLQEEIAKELQKRETPGINAKQSLKFSELSPEQQKHALEQLQILKDHKSKPLNDGDQKELEELRLRGKKFDEIRNKNQKSDFEMQENEKQQSSFSLETTLK